MIVLVPAPVHEDLTALIGEAAPGVQLLPYAEEETTLEGAEDAEVVLRWVAGKRYEGLVADGPKVRWLHTASAGVDHVLTPRVKEKPDLLVTDSGPAFGICIGEFVLGWMLMVAHCLPDILEQQRERVWRWVTQEELYGQTVGIIGLGPVGQGIAERCKAMGMRTVGLRRRPEAVPFVNEVRTGPEGLASLLAESDWVIVAAALTGESHALLGAAEFARMKPTARLVNVARGGLLDEEALITALREERIAGACLDVFTKEPLPIDSPLWEMPNVYVSPHTSPGWTTGLRQRQMQLFANNLKRYIRKEPLEGVVDIARGY
jgi:phosphoglycerate dehydrogenase-like enzyme